MMDEDKKLRMKNIFSIGAYVLLAAVTLFLYFYKDKGGNHPMLFGGVLTGFLLVFWVMMDIIRPLALHELDGVPDYKKGLFCKMAAVDLAGYAGLVYCVMNVKQNNGMGVAGAMIFVICMGYKRNARSDFERR